MTADLLAARHLRRVVLVVAALNFGYFFVEFGVALAAGSVSLLADSVDFLEDTAVNLLIAVALGWSLARRAAMGKAMALIILGPASVAGWEAIQRFAEPVAPHVGPVVLASLGAIAVNGVSAWLLVRVRHHGGSLSRAAYLSARNDVLVNLAVIAMAAGDLVDRLRVARPGARLRHHRARAACCVRGVGGQRGRAAGCQGVARGVDRLTVGDCKVTTEPCSWPGWTNRRRHWRPRWGARGGPTSTGGRRQPHRRRAVRRARRCGSG